MLRRIAVAISCVVVLMNLGGPAALADASATVYMTVAPGGDETDSIASDVAIVYIVVEYQELTDTEVTVRIAGPTGQRLFEHSEVYDGSGRDDIPVTGREILQAYMLLSDEQMQGILNYIDLAQTAGSAFAVRTRVQGTQAPIQTLLTNFGRLEDYELSLMAEETLDEARIALDDFKSEVDAVVNGDVPEEELDAKVDELETLAADLAGKLEAALDEIDTERDRPWLDGQYTTNLDRGGGVADDAEWSVAPGGTPGTPVPSPGTGDAATATPTPTQTSAVSATPTATQPEPTATNRPTSTPVPTRTPVPAAQGRVTATPVATAAPPAGGGPTATRPVIELPPTATGAAPAAPVAASPVPESASGEPEVAAAYPGPASREEVAVPAAPTEEAQIAAAVTSRDDQVETIAAARDEPAAPAISLAADTPLAPQEVRDFPATRLVALLSALTLGIVALWLRARA